MSLAAKAYARHRMLRRFGRIFMPIWIGLACIGTLMAAADTFWQLGWGYREQDALIGLSMVVFGFLFWALWTAFLKLTGWLNQIFFGPDPDDPERVTTNGR